MNRKTHYENSEPVDAAGTIAIGYTITPRGGRTRIRKLASMMDGDE